MTTNNCNMLDTDKHLDIILEMIGNIWIVRSKMIEQSHFYYIFQYVKKNWKVVQQDTRTLFRVSFD